MLTDTTRLNDPYAVCYSQFDVAVGADCSLTVTPAAFSAELKYKTVACPTSPLKGGLIVNNDISAALGRALKNATFAATFVRSATFQTAFKGVSVATTVAGVQGSLAYAVEGALSWPTLTGTDLCDASATDCSAASCADGRFDDGSVCAICPAGAACTSGAKTACDAGSYATLPGSTECTACAVDTYRAAAGGSVCDPCPDKSYAHFTGSTGCLACYFGMPKVVAGTVDGVVGFNGDLPDEQPKPGYRIVTLPSTSALGATCSLDHPFNSGDNACDSLNSRTIAIETDVTCEVRVFVLGDSKCSVADDLAVMDG